MEFSSQPGWLLVVLFVVLPLVVAVLAAWFFNRWEQ